MKKIIALGILFLILVLALCVATSLMIKENLDLKFTIIKCEERLQNCKEYCKDYSLFEQAVARIGSRSYDLEDYNCVNFSQDLIEELEEVGIRSSLATSESHAWVLVWIEAQAGDFISPDKDLEILRIRDKGMNVICY